MAKTLHLECEAVFEVQKYVGITDDINQAAKKDSQLLDTDNRLPGKDIEYMYMQKGRHITEIPRALV